MFPTLCIDSPKVFRERSFWYEKRGLLGVVSLLYVSLLQYGTSSGLVQD